MHQKHDRKLILTLKRFFLLEWSTTNLIKHHITWKHSLSYSKMNKAASLKYLWDIHWKTLGIFNKAKFWAEQHTAHSCSSCPSQTQAGVEQQAVIQNTPKFNSLFSGCFSHTVLLHSLPQQPNCVAASLATLQRVTTAQSHAQTEEETE